MLYLIDPVSPTLQVCPRRCDTYCGIKPLYGVVITE